MSNATVVTAFYEIKSKFPTHKYWTWIDNFCSIPCYLVLFTSPNLVDKFTLLREKYKDKTIIIPLKFEELYHYQFMKQYHKHYELDSNKKHSSELYIIWAEKIKFVMNAIKVNPFNSTKFIWCDIGIIRDTQIRDICVNFPNGKIKSNKMTLLLLKKFTEQDRKPDVAGIMGQQYKTVRFGGGIQAADISTWGKYDKLWDLMLQRYFVADRFAGQDQCIIGSIYLENPGLFHIVTTDSDYKLSQWGYLLYYLSK